MNITKYNLFWTWEYDREEKWLNEMAAKGLHLVKPGLCRYVFEQGSPEEYEYCLDYLDHLPNHAESRDYIGFLEDSGAEYIGSMRNWVYFRKKKSDVPFRIYSDFNSRIRHLEKIKAPLTIGIFLCTLLGAYNLFIGISVPSLINILCSVILLFTGGACLKGYRKLGRMIEKLKTEHQLHE